ncbi:MAG: XdhC family protein, partial [Desulfovibrio sp.]|nr:XdhC family protein [Desulfovibrio sp.]
MNFIDSICKALEEGRDTALVSVVEQSASSPRHAGASMLVGPEGLLAGTIGGGAMEHEAIEAGRRVIQSRVAEFMDFDLTNKDAAVADMICGGRMRLFVEPL